MTDTPPFLSVWLRIGLKNLWIREATDPPFTKKIFAQKTEESFREAMQSGNWCLGQAFYIEYDNCYLVFINQVNAGDEWLTIKSWKTGPDAGTSLAFESITFEGFVAEGGAYNKLMADLRTASYEQCRTLTYSDDDYADG